METTQVTIQLPKSEIRFLEEYTKRHKTTITELFDAYIRQLQQAEDKRALSAIDAELEQHTGIISADIDVNREYYDYLEEKHR